MARIHPLNSPVISPIPLARPDSNSSIIVFRSIPFCQFLIFGALLKTGVNAHSEGNVSNALIKLSVDVFVVFMVQFI